MPKVTFKGNPPMMDFTLIKLTGGQNLVDNQSRGIYSLGEGELTKIVTDAGQALRRSLEATLANMHANQCIRVQILMHGNVGYTFLPPHSYAAPGFGDKVRFAFSDDNDNDNNIITARGRSGRKDEQFGSIEEVKSFVIVAGEGGIIDASPGSESGIKHATPGDNDGSDIINAQ